MTKASFERLVGDSFVKMKELVISLRQEVLNVTD